MYMVTPWKDSAWVPEYQPLRGDRSHFERIGNAWRPEEHNQLAQDSCLNPCLSPPLPLAQRVLCGPEGVGGGVEQDAIAHGVIKMVLPRIEARCVNKRSLNLNIQIHRRRQLICEQTSGWPIHAVTSERFLYHRIKNHGKK